MNKCIIGECEIKGVNICCKDCAYKNCLNKCGNSDLDKCKNLIIKR